MSLPPFSYSHNGTSLTGYLALPANLESNVPGVLVVPDFMGPETARVHQRAVDVAALGYAACVVDLYGTGSVPATREEAGVLMAPLRSDRNYLRARITPAFEAFRAHAKVDPNRIAIMGYCFGGCVALELARSGAAVRGAISLHGNLDTSLPAVAGTVAAKILVLHGDRDPLSTPDTIAIFMEEMRAAEINWEMVFYSGAKHGFTNPEADAIGSPAVGYNAVADRRSAIAVREFLKEVFA